MKITIILWAKHRNCAANVIKMHIARVSRGTNPNLWIKRFDAHEIRKRCVVFQNQERVWHQSHGAYDYLCFRAINKGAYLNFFRTA